MRWSHSMVFGICFIRVMLLSEVTSSVWLDVGSSNGDVQTHLEVYVARSCGLAELHSRLQDYQQLPEFYCSQGFVTRFITVLSVISKNTKLQLSCRPAVVKLLYGGIAGKGLAF